MFSEYYAITGVVDDDVNPHCPQDELASVLYTGSFNETSIAQLKPNLTCGSDSLPPLLLKQLRFCLAIPLVLSFAQLSVGVVPDQWTKAIIIPVFKKVAAGNVSDYRPIILNVCCKQNVMERIIANHIYDHSAK